jgi:hypothetical protein
MHCTAQAPATNVPPRPVDPDQASVLELTSSGDTTTGTSTSRLGTCPIRPGRFQGSVFKWEMDVSMPFSMNVKGRVAVDGDSMQGAVEVGMFGESAMRGTRRAG